MTWAGQRKKRTNPEADAQRAIVRDLRLLLLPPCIVHHSPNEAGGASKTAQAILQGMGIYPGFSDLIVLGPDRRVAYLEVKSKTGKATPEQEAFGASVELMGWTWAVVRNTHDAIAACQRAGLPMRVVRW